ncbi:hypothetical protein PCL_06936 [Purpureocillium lilacinum]|uniref:Uncharacterized protein n=1 Tax=Purpureocillium lilacinum TaxID=33203 RepID=A0A2U3DTD7_PURLI|nr:hypothetical protein PCL_06936 [Purpureocillium lilacinum]
MSAVVLPASRHVPACLHCLAHLELGTGAAGLPSRYLVLTEATVGPGGRVLGSLRTVHLALGILRRLILADAGLCRRGLACSQGSPSNLRTTSTGHPAHRELRSRRRAGQCRPLRELRSSAGAAVQSFKVLLVPSGSLKIGGATPQRTPKDGALGARQRVRDLPAPGQVQAHAGLQGGRRATAAEQPSPSPEIKWATAQALETPNKKLNVARSSSLGGYQPGTAAAAYQRRRLAQLLCAVTPTTQARTRDSRPARRGPGPCPALASPGHNYYLTCSSYFVGTESSCWLPQRPSPDRPMTAPLAARDRGGRAMDIASVESFGAVTAAVGCRHSNEAGQSTRTAHPGRGGCHGVELSIAVVASLPHKHPDASAVRTREARPARHAMRDGAFASCTAPGHLIGRASLAVAWVAPSLGALLCHRRCVPTRHAHMIDLARPLAASENCNGTCAPGWASKVLDAPQAAAGLWQRNTGLGRT